MKREENIKRDDITVLNSLIQKEYSKGIEELNVKLRTLLFEASKEIVSEEVKRLFDKYPFVLNTTSSIRVEFSSFNSTFYYHEPIIDPDEDHHYYSTSSLLISKHFDELPVELSNSIKLIIEKIDEKTIESKNKTKEEIDKITTMTYGDLELYYPELFKFIWTKHNNIDDSKVIKDNLTKLEEKIKETIN